MFPKDEHYIKIKRWILLPQQNAPLYLLGVTGTHYSARQLISTNNSFLKVPKST